MEVKDRSIREDVLYLRAHLQLSWPDQEVQQAVAIETCDIVLRKLDALAVRIDALAVPISGWLKGLNAEETSEL